MEKQQYVPKDGLAGLKENWQRDLMSGLLVSLLALPLSLGIAKASDFPPIMGIVTAIIGGMLVGVISGARMTIKGPAAGLIVIASGAVAAFGGGEHGWQMALGCIVVAAVLQVLFGLAKLGKLSDFFPLAAVHGMLAAIGLIIISKQIHTLLGVNPATLKGMEPLELYAHIPHSIMTADWRIALIGGISLLVVIGLPMIKVSWVRRIPSPVVVLALAIPLAFLLGEEDPHFAPKYALVHIGHIVDDLKFHVSFDGLFTMPAIFAEYVILFAIIGSLESLLTGKAVDLLDPYPRKSDFNKDLIAVGAGNILAGLLGGLPMISEVARSSANVQNGAKTRWANVFHGMFLLVFALLLVPEIEMIPNAALAAMLIGVGIKLAHPREFMHMFHIGWEQLLIFIATIVITLGVDLLAGIGAGIVIKIALHILRGAPIKGMFRAVVDVDQTGDNTWRLSVSHAAVFTNYLGLKKRLDAIPEGQHIIIDMSHTRLVDHTVLENLSHFQHEYRERGGNLEVTGMDHLKPISHHPLASRSAARQEASPVLMS